MNRPSSMTLLSKRRGILEVTTWICVDFLGLEIHNIERLQQRLRECCKIFRRSFSLAWNRAILLDPVRQLSHSSRAALGTATRTIYVPSQQQVTLAKPTHDGI